jgi:hypothetical protein
VCGRGLQIGLGRKGHGRETRSCGHVHDGEREREVREGGVANRQGSQTSESVWANGRSALTGRSHRAASESGHVRGRVSADRSVPSGSARERECVRGRR